MKRELLIIFSVLVALNSVAQQVIDLQTGELGKDTESTIPERDVETLEDGYLVTYRFSKAVIKPDYLFSGTYFWKMDGFGYNQNPGEPCTLRRNDLIAIPSGFNATVEVTDSVYYDYHYVLTPARQPLWNNSKEGYTLKNVKKINPYNGFKPESIASLSGTPSYRGQDLCMVSVNPIQYNYSTHTVRAYSSITYKVTLLPENSEAAAKKNTTGYISPEDNFVYNNVINNWQPSTQRLVAENNAQSDVQDYLILSTNAYASAANRFAEWKRLMGFNVHVIIRDDWTNESVQNTVNNAYSTMPALYYLLIIGDHDDVPAYVSATFGDHVTDFYYGCIDDDLIPEIHRGRIPVSSLEEANTIIDKIIGYEQSPPSSASFYDNALHCSYFQDHENDGYETGRYAQTSEDIRSYVMTQGKSVQRVYYTEPNINPRYWDNTIYSNGEPIANELLKPGFAWNGNHTDITNAINEGCFYVLHRDHGEVDSWLAPYYSQTHASNLSNGDLLPVVFSINCSTGKFDEDCLAETFLRKDGGGCVAIYAPTSQTYTGDNDVFAVGMFEAIWPSPGLRIRISNHNMDYIHYSETPIPTYTLGQILDQGMLRVFEEYNFYNPFRTRYALELFHCFGDPSMKIYTEEPTAFSTPAIARNSNSVSVTIGNGETGRITFYNPATGDVQSFLGNTATIQTTVPKEIAICISGHNRIPFVQRPDVLYIQNENIEGTVNEFRDIIKVGSNVTSTKPQGDVTTSNADITLRAKETILDCGTFISLGTTLKIEKYRNR